MGGGLAAGVTAGCCPAGEAVTAGSCPVDEAMTAGGCAAAEASSGERAGPPENRRPFSGAEEGTSMEPPALQDELNVAGVFEMYPISRHFPKRKK